MASNPEPIHAVRNGVAKCTVMKPDANGEIVSDAFQPKRWMPGISLQKFKRFVRQSLDLGRRGRDTQPRSPAKRNDSKLGRRPSVVRLTCSLAKRIKLATLNIGLKLPVPNFCVELGEPFAKGSQLVRGETLNLPFEISNLSHLIPPRVDYTVARPESANGKGNRRRRGAERSPRRIFTRFSRQIRHGTSSVTPVDSRSQWGIDSPRRSACDGGCSG